MVFPSITKALGLCKGMSPPHRSTRDANLWIGILTAAPFVFFFICRQYSEWSDRKLNMILYKDSIVYGETYGKGNYK